MSELARLTGAGLVIYGDVAFPPGGPPQFRSAVDFGWQNGFDKTVWLQVVKELPQHVLESPLHHYFRRLPDIAGACLTIKDLIRDREWHQSLNYQLLHRPVGIDHSLICAQPLPEAGGLFNTLNICKDAGERRDFSPRDQVLVAAAHSAVSPLIGRSLARLTDPSPTTLGPRAQQVLRGLRKAKAIKRSRPALD
jgi:hypothetical protein